MDERITTLAQLREVLPEPAPRAWAKTLAALDVHCRSIIARSPFVVIASADAQGEVDVSPKGDPAGFVQVLDDRTLAVPDRPGNRRADTLRNVLANPRVALLFMVPGRAETLRVNGRATITRDAGLRERMAVAGKVPQLALVVEVDEAFVHCGKCAHRSRLWEPGAWPRVDDLPSHARCLADHADAGDVAALEAKVRDSYARGLY